MIKPIQKLIMKQKLYIEQMIKRIKYNYLVKNFMKEIKKNV